MPSSVVSSWSGVGTLFLMTKMVDDGSSPKISSCTWVPSSVRISTSEFNSSFSFPDVNKIQWISLNVACLHLYLNILCFFIRVSNLLLKIVTSFLIFLYLQNINLFGGGGKHGKINTVNVWGKWGVWCAIKWGPLTFLNFCELQTKDTS